MADNDIYNSKEKYEFFLQTLKERLLPETSLQKIKGPTGRKLTKSKYSIAYQGNLDYFRKLDNIFKTKDLSYVRRLRLMRSFIIITHYIKKDLLEVTRDDINGLVAFAHTINKSPKSKGDFILDLRYFWKNLFPENDEKGRPDEAVMPYTVRHLSPKMDKSKQKSRNDRLTWEEFEKLLNFFSNDLEIQAYIALAVESLGRPQEICYTRIRDVEHGEGYAKVYISEHGKEGTKYLKCIDSYPYLLKWLEVHPYKDQQDSFLFIIDKEKDHQLNPPVISSRLRKACEKLQFNKRITAYSLKRNGVTFARLRGDSDAEIQAAAGWTTTRQLKTYDQSGADDYMKKALVKRGLIKDKEQTQLQPKTKECICGEHVGFAEKICPKCKRILDKEMIQRNMKLLEEQNKRNELVLQFVESFIMQDEETKRKLAEFRKNPKAKEILDAANNYS
ncbi:MAG: tyrosine-type recombinase/integrase [Nanoarchaeota archaeon]|nr:tyrosine-type recombinase/integrase [Nanoarchaeota archaeon]